MAFIIKRLFFRGTSTGGTGDASHVAYDGTASGIPATNVQGAIDSLASKPLSFSTSSWVGPTVDSTYSITVPFSIHNKPNPTVTTFELNGADYSEVEVIVSVDSANNLIVEVPSTPDLRFNGKLIIT